MSRRGLHTHPGPGASWPAPSAHVGVPLQGLSFSVWGVGVARKEAGGGVLLGDLTVGGAIGARGVGITITQQIQKPPLGLWGLGSGMFFALTPIPPSCVPQVWDPAWGCRPHPRSSKLCEGVGSTQRKELLPGSLLGGDLSRTVCAPGLLATRLSQVGRDPSGAQGGHVDLQSHLSLHKAGG